MKNAGTKFTIIASEKFLSIPAVVINFVVGFEYIYQKLSFNPSIGLLYLIFSIFSF